MVRASSFVTAVGLATLLLNVPSTALSQSRIITGRVADAVNLRPIVVAGVEIEGQTGTITVTDSVGRYSISIPRPDVTLVFTAPGYAQQEMSPAGRSVINVALAPRPLALGTIPCDGAAQPEPPALDRRTPPLRMPAPNVLPEPIPNACAIPEPGTDAR